MNFTLSFPTRVVSRIFLLAVVCFCFSTDRFESQLSAQVIYDETVDGELSGDNLNPTDLNVFGIGTSMISGTVVDARGANPNVDVFTFDVLSGTQLTAIVLDEFVSDDDVAFVGLNDSNTFPFDADQLSDNPDQSQFIGGLLFGENVGVNLLDDIGSSGIGTGFTGPLGPGEYTVYLQQLGPNTVDYRFDFQVSAIPEPATGVLVGLPMLGLVIAGRRRR